MIDLRLNSYLQCQRKTDRISDNFPNKTNKYLHDITRTCKKAYKPLTESPKDMTNYNGPGGIKSGLQNYILADKSDQLREDK